MSNGQYSSHELQISSDQIILLAYYTKWNTMQWFMYKSIHFMQIPTVRFMFVNLFK